MSMEKLVYYSNYEDTWDPWFLKQALCHFCASRVDINCVHSRRFFRFISRERF